MWMRAKTVPSGKSRRKTPAPTESLESMGRLGPGKRAQPVPATGSKKDPVIPEAKDNLAQVTEVEEAEIKVDETSISGSAVVEKEESAVSVAEQSEQKEKPEDKEEEPVTSSATVEPTTVEEKEKCTIAEKPVEERTNQGEGVALVEKEETGHAVVAEQVEEETKIEEEEKEVEKQPTTEAAIVESETVTLEEKVEEGDSINGSAVVEKEETVVESANGGGTAVEKEETGQAVAAKEKKQDEEEKEEEKQPTTEAATVEPETVECKVEEVITLEETVEVKGTNGAAVVEKKEEIVVAAAAVEQVEEKKPIAKPAAIEAKEKPALAEKPEPEIIPAEKEDKKAEQGKQLSRQGVSKALKSLLSTVLSILKR